MADLLENKAEMTETSLFASSSSDYEHSFTPTPM